MCTSLALWLRTERHRARLTYTELAEKTGHAPRTLRMAASGERLPRLQLVLDFTTACGGDPGEATKHWRRARARLTKTSGGQEALRPEYILTIAELRRAMIELRAHVGNPSLRKLEERAGPGRLPRSTISLVLRGRAPLREETVVAFVAACGAQPDEVEAWRAAWKTAAAQTSAKAREKRDLAELLSMRDPVTIPVQKARAVEMYDYVFSTGGDWVTVGTSLPERMLNVIATTATTATASSTTGGTAKVKLGFEPRRLRSPSHVDVWMDSLRKGMALPPGAKSL